MRKKTESKEAAALGALAAELGLRRWVLHGGDYDDHTIGDPRWSPRVMVMLPAGRRAKGLHDGWHLTHWHMALGGAMRFPEHFDIAIGGDVNPHHGRKATAHHPTLEAMIESIRAGFAHLGPPVYDLVEKEAA